MHAHLCVFMVKFMPILVFWEWKPGDFRWDHGGMWVVRGGFMGEKLLHGDQECLARVSPDH